MKLHRLVLTNYRGITHREIDFPEHGVTVVCGPNEVGKSSMIEALDLLLESKDRSTRKDVKQVKPTHADVGSIVTAEVSTGPYRFVYRKQFNKKCETLLTVLAPQKQQLTGDEAHERVRAMLDETVDTGLWQAQRVLQASSTSAVELTGCDALSRALDLAALHETDGIPIAGSGGTEPVLIEKIDAEYARYFTPTGRPKAEWAAATDNLGAAEQGVAQCAAAVAEVDDDVHRHSVLTAELAELTSRRHDVTARVESAQASATAVAELTEELRSAQLIASAAEATCTVAAAAHAERLRLRADVDARAATGVELEAAAAEAARAESSGRAVLSAAEEAVVVAVDSLSSAVDRADAARRTVAQLSDRDEADRLTSRLARIAAAQHELDDVAAQLMTATVTDTLLAEIESASAVVGVAQGQVDLTAATVEFVADADIELQIGDHRHSLASGQTWALTAAAAAEICLPGLLKVRVNPGANAVDTAAKLSAAQQQLSEALAAAGVADLGEARAIAARRRDLIGRRGQLSAGLQGLRGDDDDEQLKARLDVLRAAQPQEPSLWDATLDATQARSELEAADAARALAAAELETHRKVAVAATAQLNERATRATVLADKVATNRAELEIVAQRLRTSRAAIGDVELAVKEQAEADSARSAQARVAIVVERVSAADPDAVAVELTAARGAAENLGRRHDETARALHAVTVELAVFGTQGRRGKLDAALIARDHASAECARVRSRARAAQLLRSVMARHRDNTRLRYVDPFRAEIERLGRTVFGPTFEVEVDSDLRICNRTVDGRTVPYESLSGGAREQLGIVARLAVAALVAKEDTVPVVIDDALGFTDPDRLAKMGAVFDAVGAHGQVIVLTCMPDRYAGVQGAHHIELSA